MSQPSSPARIGGLTVVALTVVFILAIAGGALLVSRHADNDAEFARLLNTGKNLYDKGDPGRAIDAFQKAVALNPNNPDVHLDLANAFLAANQTQSAAQHAAEVLHFEPGSAAGHYLLGCACLRDGNFTNALQSLQQAKAIDQTVNAVSYQLGRAHAGVGQWREAGEQFAEVIQFEQDTNAPIYLSAFYQLSQALMRQGRQDEAAQARADHQRVTAGRQLPADSPSIFERCRYTAIIAPLTLEQPDKTGVTVKFSDATAAAFGPAAANYHGPLGVFDINHRGTNDLFIREGDAGFRLLWNSNFVFAPHGESVPAAAGARWNLCLVGDLNGALEGRHEDAVMIGDKGVQVFRFGTNGLITDATQFAQLRNVTAADGAEADLDFTGKLGLLLTTLDGHVRSFRSVGSMSFRDNTVTSGIPANVTGVTQIVVTDWNNDDLPDVVLVRQAEPPLLLSNQRGGPLVSTNQPPEWPVARAAAFGDLNGDLRTDAVFLAQDSVTVSLGGLKEPRRLPARGHHLTNLRLLDYDNDGWLDVVAWGDDGVRIWRNRGRLGFHETTAELGLTTLAAGKVSYLAAADFDQDGDTDLVVELEGSGLKLWRNDGANANLQLKVRMLGNRSNPSGLGVKLELAVGSWRALRTVDSLPVEIGVGRRPKLDSLTTRWFDTQLPTVDIDVNPQTTVSLVELIVPTGSCPYLYAWDGQRHRFITDLLGASPLGLPAGEGRYIDADPEEWVRVGDDSSFVPREGRYTLQITEELREVLYLDEASLVAVDHPAGIEVHPTSKLLPGKPWLPHELVAVGNRHPLQQATDLDGHDVTAALRDIDGQKVSPAHLRGPQLRGLAEPHGVILDFGALPTDRPLVLALTGWLRFGGGMANIAGSHDSALPFPFPVLEAETEAGRWRAVDVRVGAPAGKTKTILVDLSGKLPGGTRRLRLTEAFEIHWNRIALFERAPSAPQITRVAPTSADLHWRGFSAFAELPWTEPLTPVYNDVHQQPDWRATVSGWVTRYGRVDELIAAKDNALALLAGGDELTLGFDAGSLPPKPAGMIREFFLRTVGWDKDADYHVAEGATVEPLPWHGMNDQMYGHEQRPAGMKTDWVERYNTRWISPLTFERMVRK